MPAPTSLRAGDSAAWSESLPDYLPSDGWALKYRILWPIGAPVDIAATPAGDDYSVALLPTDTAQYLPGRATLAAWVERTGERKTLGSQPLEILPDLALAAVHDGRSLAERGLAEAQAALLKYTESGRGHVEEYEVAGRRLKFRTIAEIRELIDYYAAQVAADRALFAALSGQSPGRVVTRF